MSFQEVPMFLIGREEGFQPGELIGVIHLSEGQRFVVSKTSMGEIMGLRFEPVRGPVKELELTTLPDFDAHVGPGGLEPGLYEITYTGKSIVDVRPDFYGVFADYELKPIEA